MAVFQLMFNSLRKHKLRQMKSHRDFHHLLNLLCPRDAVHIPVPDDDIPPPGGDIPDPMDGPDDPTPMEGPDDPQTPHQMTPYDDGTGPPPDTPYQFHSPDPYPDIEVSADAAANDSCFHLFRWT